VDYGIEVLGWTTDGERASERDQKLLGKEQLRKSETRRDGQAGK